MDGAPDPDAVVPDVVEDDAEGDLAARREAAGVSYTIGKVKLQMEDGAEFVFIDEDDPTIDYDEFDKIKLDPTSWNMIIEISKTLQLNNITDGILRGQKLLIKSERYTGGDVHRNFLLTHCCPSWASVEIGDSRVAPAGVYDILSVLSFPGYKPFATAAQSLETVEEKRAFAMNAFIAWSVAELAIANISLQMLLSEKIQNAYAAVSSNKPPEGYTVITGSAGTEMSISVKDAPRASLKVVAAHASQKLWMHATLLKNKEWTTTAIEKLTPFIKQVLKVSSKGGIVPLGRQISDLRTANYLPLELEEVCAEDPEDLTCLRFLGSIDLPKSPLMNLMITDQVSLLNGATACLKDKKFDQRKPQTVQFIRSRIPALQSRKRTTRSGLT